MRGLILRDVFALRRQAALWAFYVIVCAIWLLQSASEIAAMVFMVFACTTGLGLFNTDEASGSLYYIRALPVSAREIVTARYIVQLSLGAIGLAMGAAIAVICGAGLLQFLAGAVAMLVMFVGVASPLMYRFGSTKGRLMMLISTFGVLGLGFLLVQIMRTGIVSVDEAQVHILANAVGSPDGRAVYIAIDGWIESHQTLFAGGFLALAFAFVAVSWAISCHIVGKTGK